MHLSLVCSLDVVPVLLPSCHDVVQLFAHLICQTVQRHGGSDDGGGETLSDGKQSPLSRCRGSKGGTQVRGMEPGLRDGSCLQDTASILHVSSPFGRRRSIATASRPPKLLRRQHGVAHEAHSGAHSSVTFHSLLLHLCQRVSTAGRNERQQRQSGRASRRANASVDGGGTQHSCCTISAAIV